MSMALEQYHHLKHDSTKIQVDSAIRDGNGAKIDTTYLKKTESAPNAINATNAVNDGAGNKIDETYLKVSDLLNSLYPIGSIYTSVSSTDPHDIFGGTWEEVVHIGTENESSGQIDVTVYMWKRTA